LLDWLKQRYPEHASSITLPSHYTQPWAIHDALADAFLSVARALYTNATNGDPTVDPELQVGLGVVFYLNGDFSKASDCFSSALSVRPDDYILWNRYGSCLSNGQQPEEALGAYREALRLRPGYTRAVYNVGVACLNLGAHQEAAEHFLSGLAMQGGPAGAGGVDATKRSEQLWGTLKRTLVAMVSVCVDYHQARL
jgi:peroxin-5